MERLQLEKNQYARHSKDYFQLEKALRQQEGLRRERESMKEALKEQRFQVGLLQDRRLLIDRDRQRIEAQEARIRYLRAELERENPEEGLGHLDLMYARHQRDFLREKKKQVQTQL